MILVQPSGLAQVVQCFELHAEDLGADHPSWIPFLPASLNVPTRSGIIINANRFTLGSICEMQGSGQGFRHKVFLGKKWYLCNSHEKNMRHLF
jgi:hypothetical protein